MIPVSATLANSVQANEAPSLGSRICERVGDVAFFPFRCLANFFSWMVRPIVGFCLKASVYQSMALDQSGSLVKCCCAPILRGIVKLWGYCRGDDIKIGALDSVRLERGEQFIRQFAEFETLITSDGQELRFAVYKPEALTQWIEANGGVRDGEWIRPRTPADWDQIQKLREFRWFEEVDGKFRVPVRVDALQNKCILRCQGFGRTIPMDKGFIGAHMAIGINYAIFDWRKGDLSSTGMFEDAETVYQALLSKGFTPSQIVPMGSCRATFVMGKLVEDHYAEGMSAVLIQSPPSLEQMILKQGCIAKFLALAALPKVESKKGDYDTIARLNQLPPSDLAKLCVILSENDQTLPEDTEAQFRDLPCNPSMLIVPSTSDSDSHLQEPLRNAAIFDQYVEFLQG